MQNGLVLLFGSDTRVRLLEALLLEDLPLSLSELASKAEVDIGAAHRELAKLSEIELVKVNGTPPNYSLNSHSYLYAGIKEIFKKSRQEKAGYLFLEEVTTAYPLLLYSYMNVDLINNFLTHRGFNSRLTRTLMLFENSNSKLYADPKEYAALVNEIVETILQNPEFGLKDSWEVMNTGEDLFKLADEVAQLNYSALSNRELALHFSRFYKAQEKLHAMAWVQNPSDSIEMLFTKKLMHRIRGKVTKTGKKFNVADLFSTLTTPLEKSYMQTEHEELLTILKEVNEDKQLKELFKTNEPRHVLEKISGTKIGKAISSHAEKYGWLGYGYVGPNWDEAYFVGILSSLARQGQNPQALLEEEKTKSAKLKSKQEKIEQELEFSVQEKRLFEAARQFVFAKGHRKDCMFKFFSSMEHLYAEIARRLFISINDVRFAYPDEISQILEGKFNLATLRSRRNYSIYESFNAKDTRLDGKTARKYVDKLVFEKEELPDADILSGTCATAGRIRGSVKIINVVGDIPKMRAGDVLVSIATMPDLVPAMKKAAAIVTDMGGLTCHAAIVSRELNIPCVVGVKFATQIFKDDDLVEVDATHGQVKKI